MTLEEELKKEIQRLKKDQAQKADLLACMYNSARKGDFNHIIDLYVGAGSIILKDPIDD